MYRIFLNFNYTTEIFDCGKQKIDVIGFNV